MSSAFDAFVTAALFDKGKAAFTLGDGTVRWEDGLSVQAHDGAILSAAAHPSGEGVITGGDDGRLVWSCPSGPRELAKVPGRWIDAVAGAPDSGLIAFAAGREARVIDAADPAFARLFTHEKSVADLTFDPRGRRLATATYGGVALWYARIADQKPVMLRWAGSHVGLAFSPDGKFLISAMQENALHGWRISDAKDMRMGGYPAKIRSLAFLEDGLWLATAGANGVVLWPFQGANGPMGKQATEIGIDESALVSRVAGSGALLAAGLDDGRVWATNLKSQKVQSVKAEKGAPITALALEGTRVAWGDEDGGAGTRDLPDL